MLSGNANQFPERVHVRRVGHLAQAEVGHRKRILEPHRSFIVERINQTSHLTLHGLKDELAACGVKVSHDTVWTFLRREGLRFKKTLFALEQARADIARRRRRWRTWQSGLDPSKLVFIDETWIKTNMAPLRGWGQKGKGTVRNFVREACFRHWLTNLSPKTTANCDFRRELALTHFC
jgi:hypothetical protein